MAVFTDYKSANSDLELSALDLAIILAPYSATMPTTLEDPATGDLVAVPDDFRFVGNFEKKAGVGLNKDTSSTDIESYGLQEPSKKIMSKQVGSIEYVPQETNRLNLEVYNQVDYSTITPSAHGGVVLPGTKRPKFVPYRAILLGVDGDDGNEVHPYWLLPKVAVSKTDKQTLNDDGVLTYPVTLTWFRDKNFFGGVSYAQGFCGPGWEALRVAAGFGDANPVNEVQIVLLTGSPTGGSFTLTLAGQTTAALDFDATAVEVQTAVAALSNVGVGNVAVTGAAGGPWTITFQGELAGTNVGQLTKNATGLTGGTSPNVVVATQTEGHA
jgi:hypothetical protein